MYSEEYKLAEYEVQKAKEVEWQALLMLKLAEEFIKRVAQKFYFEPRYSEIYDAYELRLVEAGMNYDIAKNLLVKAELKWNSLKQIIEDQAARTSNEEEEFSNEAKEETSEEVVHMTLDSIGHESAKIDMVSEQVVEEEDSYYVEPVIIDFIFAPNNLDHSDKARLLDFLPKIFSFSNHSRSWRYTTSCFTLPKRASPFPYNPQPTLFRDYTHVRGWSIDGFKWPWKFRVNKLFEWCFDFKFARERSYSSLVTPTTRLEENGS